MRGEESVRAVFSGSVVMVVSCGSPEAPGCPEGTVETDADYCLLIEEESVADTDEPVTDPPAPSDEPSPYVQDQPVEEAMLSLIEIEQGMSEAIGWIQRVDPRQLHEAYESMRRTGDSVCPEYDEDYYADYERLSWDDACTAESGTMFSGSAYSYHHEPYTDDDGDYFYEEHSYFSGSAKIEASDGRAFHGSGYSAYYVREQLSNGNRRGDSYIYGNFRWDGDEDDENWLDDDLNIWIDMQGNFYPEYPAVQVSYTASVAGIDGPISAVYLDGVYLYEELLGSMCGIEPGGRFSVRDSVGNWYQADFDGPTYWGAPVFPPDCDSCATVYYRGAALGTVCPDFSMLWTWLSRPW